MRGRGRAEKRVRESQGERKGEGEGEKHTDLLFHFFMHSLVISFMCPDQGLNLQPWHTGTIF